MSSDPRTLVFLARKDAAEGHYTEAVDSLKKIPSGAYPGLENAVLLMRTAPAAVETTQRLPALHPPLEFIYMYVGAPERFLEPLEDGLAADYLPPVLVTPVWQPGFASLRNGEPFKRFARDYGLVEYWRVKGWPELCHPVGTDDFACD